MLGNIGFYAFGFLGFIIHILLKVKSKEGDGALINVWKYVFQHQVSSVLVVMTYTAIFWMWAMGAIPALREFSLWFSPIISYSANSFWGHLTGIVTKKVSTTGTVGQPR